MSKNDLCTSFGRDSSSDKRLVEFREDNFLLLSSISSLSNLFSLNPRIDDIMVSKPIRFQSKHILILLLTKLKEMLVLDGEYCLRSVLSVYLSLQSLREQNFQFTLVLGRPEPVGLIEVHSLIRSPSVYPLGYYYLEFSFNLVVGKTSYQFEHLSLKVTLDIPFFPEHKSGLKPTVLKKGIQVLFEPRKFILLDKSVSKFGSSYWISFIYHDLATHNSLDCITGF